MEEGEPDFGQLLRCGKAVKGREGPFGCSVRLLS